MTYFRREGHPVVTPQAFLDFVGDHLPQEAFLDLPILTGEDLYEVAMAKMAGIGMKAKLFLYLGLSDSPWSSGKLKLLVDGLRVSLMRTLR